MVAWPGVKTALMVVSSVRETSSVFNGHDGDGFVV